MYVYIYIHIHTVCTCFIYSLVVIYTVSTRSQVVSTAGAWVFCGSEFTRNAAPKWTVVVLWELEWDWENRGSANSGIVIPHVSWECG